MNGSRYVTVPLLVHATKEILDNWGSEGWELVAVVPGANPENLVAYMKQSDGYRRVSLTQRLVDLGIDLPPVAAPASAYVPATVCGDLVYTAGQLPFVDGALPMTGKVGAEVSVDEATALARDAALNALAAAATCRWRGCSRASSRLSSSSPVPRTSSVSRRLPMAPALFLEMSSEPPTPAARSVSPFSPWIAPVEVEIIVELARS